MLCTQASKELIFITLQWGGEMILDHINFHVCIEGGVQVNKPIKPKAKANTLFFEGFPNIL